MGTARVTIEVDEAAAKAFAGASPGERQKLQLHVESEAAGSHVD